MTLLERIRKYQQPPLLQRIKNEIVSELATVKGFFIISHLIGKHYISISSKRQRVICQIDVEKRSANDCLILMYIFEDGALDVTKTHFEIHKVENMDSFFDTLAHTLAPYMEH